MKDLPNISSGWRPPLIDCCNLVKGKPLFDTFTSTLVTSVKKNKSRERERWGEKRLKEANELFTKDCPSFNFLIPLFPDVGWSELLFLRSV